MNIVDEYWPPVEELFLKEGITGKSLLWLKHAFISGMSQAAAYVKNTDGRSPTTDQLHEDALEALGTIRRGLLERN